MIASLFVAFLEYCIKPYFKIVAAIKQRDPKHIKIPHLTSI